MRLVFWIICSGLNYFSASLCHALTHPVSTRHGTTLLFFFFFLTPNLYFGCFYAAFTYIQILENEWTPLTHPHPPNVYHSLGHLTRLATPAHFSLCSYEQMSAILKPDNNLSAILRPKCHWWGWRELMEVADVTGVAWQQICVSSWQVLAASPVSGDGWTHSSGVFRLSWLCLAFSLCLSLFLWLSLTDGRCFRKQNEIISKVNWTSSKYLSCQINL